MAQIYQTENFIVESREKPFISRTDGGHIRILCKDESITDRTKLSPVAAIELMCLTMIVGEAMEKGLNIRGIKVVKINYQDMGNWAFKNGEKPHLHIHLFGRAQDAKYQIFPEAVQLPDRSTGFYDKFEPLNEGDVIEIRKQIEIIEKQQKYVLEEWCLKNSSASQSNKNDIQLVPVVAGVVMKRGGKYILVQEKNPNVFGLWNLPAGKVDAGDSIEATAIKEAREETGFEVELGKKIDIFQEYITEPPKHAFVADIIGGKLNFSKDELLDVRWFSLEEIEGMRDKLRGAWVLEAIRLSEKIR